MAIRPNRGRSEPRLLRPNYIEYNRSGTMIAIYCKLCGNEIAARDDRGVLVYSNDYAELKMSFMDNSKHVTNCCRTCLPKISASKELMDAIHKADIDQMLRENPEMNSMRINKTRVVRRFMKADTRGVGLT